MSARDYLTGFLERVDTPASLSCRLGQYRVQCKRTKLWLRISAAYDVSGVQL
jgi:hypothetical protein